jgi:hypothetical protein
MKFIAIAAFTLAIGQSLIGFLQIADSMLSLSMHGYDAFKAVPRGGHPMEWAVAMMTCGFILLRLGREPKP